MAVKEPTPERFPTTPPRMPRSGGEPLTSAVIDLSMAVGELKNAVNMLSVQGLAQTQELKEIRDQITAAKSVKFIAWIAGFIGVATIIRLWPIIRAWLG